MAENPSKQVYEFHNVNKQYYAVLTANLITFTHGCTNGWISPALVLLMSDASPLKTGALSTEQMSWIGSINCLGGLCGVFTIGLITNFMGCKRAMIFLAVPAVLFWLVIMFCETANWLIFARFISGWCGGGIQSSSLLFVAEIADDRIRGSLGSINLTTRNFGALLAYGLGAYVPYEYSPYIYVSMPIVYLILFGLLPNTPRYLVQKRKFSDAEKSLKYYKGCKCKKPEEAMAIAKELDRLKSISDQRQSDSKLNCGDICQRDAVKAILIGILLPLMNHMTGWYALITYAGVIFAKIGTAVNPYTATIVLGVLQIVGSLLTTQLADKLGRKILLNIALIGSVLGQIALATVLYMDKLGFDMQLFRWVPIASIGFIVFITAVGSISLVGVCTVEMLPSKVRTFGISVFSCASNICAFAVAKSFPILCEILEIHGCMAIMAAVSIVGIMYASNVRNG